VRVLLWAIACAAPPLAPGAEDPAVLPAISRARVMGHTAAVLSVGPRLLATPAEEEAAQIVSDRLAATGLQVRDHWFSFDAWRPGTATIAIGGEVREVRAFSPTPIASVVAPLEDAAAPSDAVTVYSSDTGSRAEQFLLALAGGSSAFVRITEALGPDGEELVEVGHTLQGSLLPGVGVDETDGAWVRAHLGEEATLEVVPDIAPHHLSRNIEAIREGTGPGAVVVVAHYDSWDLSESAFDNGLGVGGLLAYADRIAAGPAPEATVILLATSGEEQGLQGASAYVADHPELFAEPVTVLTLDVVWSGAGVYKVMATDPAWITAGVFAAEAEGIEAVAGEGPGVASDHFPFAIAGASAIWAGRFGDPHYHTAADTLDGFDGAEATAAVRANWRVVAEAAGLDPDPGPFYEDLP
jgi:hypothetical protein